jgi:hypothetical protein
MSFDLSLFSKLEKTEQLVYFNSDLDVTALRVLYENCIRMGVDNSNVQIATVHPNAWFGDFFHLFRKTIKLVPKNPVFQLLMVESNHLVEKALTCNFREFKSDQELVNFFEQEYEYGSIAVFSLVKAVNLVTFEVNWRLRFIDLTTAQEVRSKKLDKIL